MTQLRIIVFRVDASIEIGSGHVMRCLTLAHSLRNLGVTCLFICRELPGHLADLVQEQGFQVILISYVGDEASSYQELDALKTIEALQGTQKDVYWVIIDHYSLDFYWEREVRLVCKNIMVIDDLANRVHDCDVLLDQNLIQDKDIRYDELTPHHCKKFLGPQYALLRDEFHQYAVKHRERTGTISRILVSMGGSDPANQTNKIVETIALLDQRDLYVDVVLGKMNPYAEQIIDNMKILPNSQCHIQTNKIAQLMDNADLIIGAGGTTTWERCILGVPSITLIIAENQIELTEMVHAYGATINLGYYKNVTKEKLEKALTTMLQNPQRVRELGINSRNIMGQYFQSKDELLRALMGGDLNVCS